MNQSITANQFLTFLFGEGSPHTFQTIDKNGKCSIFHGQLTEYESILRQKNQAANGIFYSINQTDGNGRKTDNIICVRTFVIDLDGAPLEPVLKVLKASNVNPQVVVETSPEKYHVYIKIYDCPLDLFKPIQRALAQKFNGDKAVCDLPRVMRLPGFYHHKREPFLTHIIEINDTPAYSYSDVIERLKLDLEQQTKASSEPININQPFSDGTPNRCTDKNHRVLDIRRV